jgi:hypothetical protein
MAVSCATGRLNITTGAAASTVDSGDLGITLSGATVVIFWWNGLTATNNGTRATARRGMGWAVSSSSFYAVGNYDEDGAGTAVAKNNVATDGCIIEIDNAAAVVGRADLQSFGTNNFVLEIQDAFVTDLLVHYWVITGLDNAEIGSFTPTPGNQTVNNSGNFQPHVTFFMHGAQYSGGSDTPVMIGAATSSSDDHVHQSGANDGSTSGTTGSYNLSGECLAWQSTSPVNAPTNRAEFVSHNAGPGGFTINWLERANAPAIRYLSLRGGNWIVGNLLTQTDTTTAITESGFGWTPAGMLFVSAAKAQTTQDATPATHDEWSVGCATSASARNCCQMDSRSGNTTMFVHLASRADCVYANSDPANTAYTLEGLMDVQSFDTNAGFTCIMDDADPSQAFVWYAAVGNVTAAGTTRRYGLPLVGIG